MVLQLKFHTEMMEKVKNWDRCKICDTAAAAVEGEEEGQPQILIKMLYGITYIIYIYNIIWLKSKEPLSFIRYTQSTKLVIIWPCLH